jgi:hypothetical protein
MLFYYYYFRGGPKSKEAIPKEAIPKEAIPKEAIPKEAIPKEAIPKEAINCFLFIKKEAIASFGNCFVFCETLLCVERLACYVPRFGWDAHDNESRRQQMTNTGHVQVST